MKAVRLLVEGLASPLGLGERKPRLSWNLVDGISQTAFEINVKVNGKNAYEAKVESPNMHFDLPFELASRDVVEWSIIPYDEAGRKGEASSSSFEMGLLEGKDWEASWISGDYLPSKKKRYPVDCFRKAFSSGKAKKARLYISACGLYEAKINGRRVGKFVLAPGHTDYDKRIQEQAYDVTSLLSEGENKIEVELADGYYRDTERRPSSSPSSKSRKATAGAISSKATRAGIGATTGLSALPTTKTGKSSISASSRAIGARQGQRGKSFSRPLPTMSRSGKKRPSRASSSFPRAARRSSTSARTSPATFPSKGTRRTGIGSSSALARC